MDQEWLKQFPVKLHPDDKMKSEFVALFISEEPQLFLQLQNLLREKKDLAEIMRHFYRFRGRHMTAGIAKSQSSAPYAMKPSLQRN